MQAKENLWPYPAVPMHHKVSRERSTRLSYCVIVTTAALQAQELQNGSRRRSAVP
jgi:hypothetical protein